jgi:flagellar assembly protein FliH
MIIKKQRQDGTSPENINVNADNVDLFDLDNIDFKQRNERRRGDRRRGFRRVDDRNLISRAREEAQAIKDAAAKEGFAQGLEQAKAELMRLQTSLTSFVNAKQEVFDQIAPHLLEIGLDIAKKIIKQEITQNPEVLMKNVTEILKGLSKDETKITIKANPAQVALIKQSIPEVCTNMGIDAKIHVIPDETVFDGGCVVTTTNGVIDATIDTQLAIITEALK